MLFKMEVGQTDHKSCIFRNHLIRKKPMGNMQNRMRYAVRKENPHAL